jgi:hypothetical protein
VYFVYFVFQISSISSPRWTGARRIGPWAIICGFVD